MVPSKNVLIDSEQINNLKQLFKDGFVSLVDTYLQDFELKDKELLGYINEKKLDNVTKIAHSLKGSSLNMGALSLANACYQIEMASKRGNAEEIMTEYNELKNIHIKTKEAFQQL